MEGPPAGGPSSCSEQDVISSNKEAAQWAAFFGFEGFERTGVGG
jgi:hypothetical protein